ncbi:MAG: guanosine monophosphate reductase [Parcubacteria group bacterium CG10_big_fil_rev_8_21_14_0_10_46_32]|nr:MAG: guanosine monophosphate reductase [Parcubacteria group bacterium CG10_big_fil_rev_8_21_14_0_10_46_32]
MQEALTFDDVLLIPRYSEILPADANLATRVSRTIEVSIPLLSSPMDTVTESDLAIELARLGGIGIIHRNFSIQKQALEVKRVKRAAAPNRRAFLVGAAIGTGKDSLERAHALAKAKVDVIVVDTAHGHSKGVIDMVAILTSDKAFGGVDIIAGNIATADAARALIRAGADGIKVGMGPGSICTTRIVAGIGMPQITAILEVVKGRGKKLDVPVIADGGIKYSGDIVKALGAGADAVMLGSLFAGTHEAPGDSIEVDGVTYKAYRGMGSLGAMGGGSADRYGQGKVRDTSKFVPEGIEGRIPYRGKLSDVVHQLSGGIRSGMGYVGASTIKELHQKAEFIKVTVAGIQESHPHNIQITKEAPNYRS